MLATVISLSEKRRGKLKGGAVKRRTRRFGGPRQQEGQGEDRVWGQRATPKRKWEAEGEQWKGLDGDRQSWREGGQCTKHRKMRRKR